MTKYAKDKRGRLITAALAAGLALTACTTAGHTESADKEKPATLEQVEGTTLKRITLIPRAAERLGLKTAAVAETNVDGQVYKTVPYAALLYDPNGKTWVYTSPQELTFIRHEVQVVRIDEDTVLLADGPAAGVQVVTVGVSELYGAEVGVGK